MTKITLWGTSFAKIGDEAQLLAMAELLRSPGRNVDLTLLSRPRARATRLYPDIPQIRLAKLHSSIRRLARSDLLIVVGAPFFEHWRQMLACVLVLSCARVFGVPVVAYGVTVFDLQTSWGKRLYRTLLNRMEFIAVREQSGQDTLRRLGVRIPVHLIVDTRAVLSRVKGEPVNACPDAGGVDWDLPIVCVTTRYIDENVPDWVKRDHGFTIEHVRNATSALAQTVAALARKAQIVVIPMHPTLDEDQAMVDVMRQQADDAGAIYMLPSTPGTGTVIEVLARSEMVISSRLASTVLALSQATPTVALAYEGRQHDVMDRVGEPDLVVDWRSLRDGQLLELCEKAWQSRKEIRSRLRRQTQEDASRTLVEAQLLTPYLKI